MMANAPSLLALAPAPSELDRGLVRLRAAVAEEHAVEVRVSEQQLRELQLRDAVEEVRDLDQPG